MKKNGFTLIELLGVIIILSLIALIAFPAIEQSLKFSSDKVYKSQISQIEKATSDWASEHMEQLPSSGSITVTINDLVSLGYIEKDIVNPKTNRKLCKNGIVRIEYKNNKYVYTVEESTIDTETCVRLGS